MRQVNIFRTDKRDHYIPREIMYEALKLSPGKDWCDPETDAYQYLKKWALRQDEKKDGPMETPLEKGAEEQIAKKIREDLMDNSLQLWLGHRVPLSVINEAMKLYPDKPITDKRTKAYKYLKEWALKQDELKDGKDNRT